MFVSRVLSRISRTRLSHCRGVVSSRQELSPIVSNHFHSLRESSNSVTSLHQSVSKTIASQQLRFTSSAYSQPTEKESNQPGEGHETVVENNNASKNSETSKPEGHCTAGGEQMEDAGSSVESKPPTGKPVKRRRGITKRIAFSDSDAEDDLSMDDLVKLVAEKEELLKAKHKEIEKMQDKILRSYADMENVMDRTRREAENSKKFAIWNFAKSLLDVADNLGRASSVVKESYSKIDPSKDTVGAVPLLKTLLEGVEMTEKQLIEVFRKFGVEKFDPMNEQFDPHRHLAVFQIPDASKPPGTVATVLKSGYMLYDRIIRPAEVGVTQASENKSDQSSGA
ncbi:GrpE nucleotide exchange factor [Macleaya cordata]|uniref:GrpE protein homolog n=1 Tax=Macleaya cordata TaxID=56857 RepID=A0A200RBE2_MACCD|nr:GrpE nucleotide exchange factor [Macleaya cordata]